MADPKALFEAHQRGVLRYLTRVVGHADAAQDLTQDVFVRVTRATTLPEEGAAQRAWLFTIARNLAIDHQRRQRFRETDDIQALDPHQRDTSHTSVVVNEALATLDALARDMFVMRELAGLSYDDIAIACETTPDAVRSRLHRARLHLREHLQRPLADARHHPMRAGLRKD